MNETNVSWMMYSTELAERSPRLGRRVGAALVSIQDRLLCAAFEGEDSGSSWSQVLLRKIRVRGVHEVHSLYLTVNTLSSGGSFELAEVLKSLQVERIYIGMPDPNLTGYLQDDPVATRDQISRYSEDLQRVIVSQNMRLYSRSAQSIRCNPHYSEHRIGEAVLSSLASRGFPITEGEVTSNRRKDALSSLISQRYEVNILMANDVVREALSAAFDAKYGAYDYARDARSADPAWVESFMSVHRSLAAAPLASAKVINVGVGSGTEAGALFSECLNVTFVDIAKQGLRNIHERLPFSRTLVASADDLSAIPSDSYELYVSLRTYNSSFFDTYAAASEACRVLKPGGRAIISVANGFLNTEGDGVVVPGLILPGTDFVDLYRGLDTARSVLADLEKVGFEGVRIIPATTEIFLTGVAT